MNPTSVVFSTKMKIRYISDLHLEFVPENEIDQFLQRIPPGIDEVAVLAGDISDPTKGQYKACMDYFSKHFNRTYIIAGNHEFYRHGMTIDQTITFMTSIFKHYTNVLFLNNTIDVFEGRIFAGTTLWSHLTDPHYLVNDKSRIAGFTMADINRRHAEAVEFIDYNLQFHGERELIIITHHLPSYQLIHPNYIGLKYNQCYASNLDTMLSIYGNVITVWIYGHTHTPSEKELMGTLFVCNPHGYNGENPSPEYRRVLNLK